MISQKCKCGQSIDIRREGALCTQCQLLKSRLKTIEGKYSTEKGATEQERLEAAEINKRLQS